MQPGVATKIIAAVIGLIAFVVAIIAGLAADNPADTILLRAIVALIVMQAVGFAMGSIGERTMVEAASNYQRNNPVPASRHRTSSQKNSASEQSTSSPEIT